MALRESMIVGFCNPLLDISATVDTAFLEKYNLKANSAILGEDSHLKIYDDLKSQDIEYIPGGSAQNALRTASWIINQPNVCTFMGCIGDDKNAMIMKEKAAEVGLKTVYQTDVNTPTGTCAVLISGNDRSLVAHLAAANNFNVSHLDNPENWAYVEKAQIFYISGFFFTVSTETIQRVAKFALENNRTFAMNLSAPFISQFFTAKLLEAMPYVDILFGNDDEAKTFAKHALNLETDNINEIVLAIQNMSKLNDKKRIVIITQGDKPVVYTDGTGVIREIPVQSIAADKIIDTNGAGDAFVGGFLSQYVKGQSLEKAIDCGIWSSSLVIQRSGCTFPETMNYQ